MMNWSALTEHFKTADDALSLAFLRCRESGLTGSKHTEALYVAMWNARNEVADAVHQAFLARKLEDEKRGEEARNVQ